MITLSDSEVKEIVSLINRNMIYEIPRNIPGFTFGRENLVSFLKDFYRNYNELLEVGSVLNIVDFIHEKEFTKECIDIVFKNRDSNSFFRRDLNGLLFRMGSVDYIMEFVKNNKEEFCKIDILDLYFYLTSLDSDNKVKYADYFIKNRNEFGLRNVDIVMIITGVSDDEFIKKYIDEREKYGFDNKTLSLLIENVSDKSYIVDCLKHIQDFNIDEVHLSNLLLFVNNPSRVVNKLINDDSIPLDRRVSLVIATKDTKLIDKCLNNRFVLDLPKEDTIRLLTFASRRIKDEAVENPALYGLEDDLDLFPILKSLGKEAKAKTIIRKLDIDNFEIPNKIKTPGDLLFGVELECTGLKSISYTDYSFYPLWKGKREGSVREGLEVTSPPSRNIQRFVNTLNLVTTVLKKGGFFVNSSCGGHIHFDLAYFDDQKEVEKQIPLENGHPVLETEAHRTVECNKRTIYSLRNLLEIWNNNEDLFYIISNPPGEATEKNRLFYSSSTSKNWAEAIRSGNVNINSENDLKEFKRQIRVGQRTKNVSLNTGEYSGHHTIEFRLSNASLDPNTWMENISLYGGLMECCRNLTRIMVKNDNDRTPEEIEKLKKLTILNTSNISREERLDLLLDFICQDEEQKNLLKKRYDANYMLFETDEDLSYFLNNTIAKRPLLFRPKSAYFRDVTSDEYTQVSSNIENELEEKNKVEEI